MVNVEVNGWGFERDVGESCLVHGSGKGYLIGLKTDAGMHLHSLLTSALCGRSFKEQCLVFLPTKKEAHRMRIIFGLLDLKATELHGALSQLQVHP